MHFLQNELLTLVSFCLKTREILAHPKSYQDWLRIGCSGHLSFLLHLYSFYYIHGTNVWNPWFLILFPLQKEADEVKLHVKINEKAEGIIRQQTRENWCEPDGSRFYCPSQLSQNCPRCCSLRVECHYPFCTCVHPWWEYKKMTKENDKNQAKYICKANQIVVYSQIRHVQWAVNIWKI